MSRIELRYCTPYICDGLAGSMKVNEPGTAPVKGAVSFAINTIALNTVDTDKVPVGARFTIAGESTATTVHTVTACTPSTGATESITFTPALGDGTYSKTATVTVLCQKLEIKVGEGDMKYSTAKQYHYDKDRGLLDTVRQGDDVEMDVSFNFTWQYTRSGSGQAISPEEAFTQTGNASEWVSTGEVCEPYAVDFVVEYVPPCGSSNEETYLFPAFRGEKYDHAFKDSNVALSGKCNATEPTVTRG